MPPVVAAVAAVVGYISIAEAIFLSVVSLYGSYQARKARRQVPASSVLANQRAQSVRQPITHWRYVYGQVLAGGPITFIHATNNNQFLNVLVTLAAHPVAAIGDVYFNDERIAQEADGTVRGRWEGFAEIYTGDGTAAGDAALLAALAANAPGKWTAAHEQEGRAKLYVRFKFNQELFRSGLPNLRAVVKGKLLFDPRTSTTVWSNNWALVLRDYLADAAIGLAAPAAELDDTALIAAANIADEQVATAALAFTFTAQALAPPPGTLQVTAIVPESGNTALFFNYWRVTFVTAAGETTGSAAVRADALGLSATEPFVSADLAGVPLGPSGVTSRRIYRASMVPGVAPADGDYLLAGTIADNVTATFTDTAAAPGAAIPTANTAGVTRVALETGAYLRTGDAVQVASTGTLPGGLAPATTYFYISSGGGRDNFATSLANARAGAAIALTSAGSGTHTVTRTAEPRYGCDGVVNAEDRPRDILQGLLTAGHGRLLFVNGRWLLYAGAYRAPTVTLDADDLDGNPQVTTRLGRRALFNAVKGVFVDPAGAWQPTDFPPVVNATYLAEDNAERIWHDIELPYTLSAAAAQRIGKLELEEARQQITVRLPCKLAVFGVQAGDVVGLTFARFGWTDKPFEVIDFEFALRGGGSDNPTLGIDLFLRETAAAAYDWASGEETLTDPAPDTDLPDPFTVAAPTPGALASGTAHLYTRRDGTVFSRLFVPWTLHPDQFVQQGGRIEIEYRRATDTGYTKAGSVPGGETFTYILDVQDTVQYFVRIRAVNNLGSRSAWADYPAHTVVGKTALPANPGGLVAAQNGNVAVFRVNKIEEVDFYAFEFRYGPVGSTDYDSMTPIVDNLGRKVLATGTQASLSTADLPPGSHTIAVKAIDTSGNYSALADFDDLNFVSTSDVVAGTEQSPAWLGTRTGFVKHWTGVLVPDTVALASALTDAELWDEYLFDPVAVSRYEAPEIDIGFDNNVRVWAAVQSRLGPGETAGVAAPAFELDFRTAAGAYDGFEPWSIGNRVARFFKPRVVADPAVGKIVLEGFQPVVDLQEYTQEAQSLTVAAGGTAVVFPQAFHRVPFVEVAATGNSALIAVADNITATGFTFHIFNSSGTDVGGTGRYQATGV